MEDKKKEENKDEAQVRGFINSITRVFDLHEEKGDNNYIFCALIELLLDLLTTIRNSEHLL